MHADQPISTYGTSGTYAALYLTRIADGIELRSEIVIYLGAGRYDVEELDRKVAGDFEEAILFADDMQHAARRRLGEMDAGDLLTSVPHGFGEAVEAELVPAHVLAAE